LALPLAAQARFDIDINAWRALSLRAGTLGALISSQVLARLAGRAIEDSPV